jgi:YD repeat-containing protein
MNESHPRPKVNALIAAFDGDGFQVDPTEDVFSYYGGLGIRATHRSATIGQTNERKAAYYIEGNPYAMGYLMGYMAEPTVARMCDEYVPNIMLNFIRKGWRDKGLFTRIITMALRIAAYWIASNIYPDVPWQYKVELEGLLEGCRAANPDTSVNWDELWLLNFGFDALLSIAFVGGFRLPKAVRGDGWLKREPLLDLAPRALQIPLMCNGFSVCGTNPDTGEDYHYFGRDFMFGTAGVFEYTTCTLVQRPQGGLPFVSVTAPGMIGTVAGMNAHGVAVGVDVGPSGACDPTRAGFNSLLLARHSIENGRTIEEAIETMVDAQRGVSWIYPLADGTSQRACIVEAGRKTPALESLDYVPHDLREHLPDASFLRAHPTAEDRQGLMVRWSDYRAPDVYLDFNRGLFQKDGKPYDAGAFGERAYINPTWKDKSVPSMSYFSPQRETRDGLVLTSNNFVIPEMRLCAMHDWTARVARAQADDVQWRYDALNDELLAALEKGYVTYNEAKQIVNFIRPDGKYATYYNPEGKPLSQASTEGSVSLMDLKAKTIESHYGFCSDEWITIHLLDYLV